MKKKLVSSLVATTLVVSVGLGISAAAPAYAVDNAGNTAGPAVGSLDTEKDAELEKARAAAIAEVNTYREKKLQELRDANCTETDIKNASFFFDQAMYNTKDNVTIFNAKTPEQITGCKEKIIDSIDMRVNMAKEDASPERVKSSISSESHRLKEQADALIKEINDAKELSDTDKTALVNDVNTTLPKLIKKLEGLKSWEEIRRELYNVPDGGLGRIKAELNQKVWAVSPDKQTEKYDPANKEYYAAISKPLTIAEYQAILDLAKKFEAEKVNVLHPKVSYLFDAIRKTPYAYERLQEHGRPDMPGGLTDIEMMDEFATRGFGSYNHGSHSAAIAEYKKVEGIKDDTTSTPTTPPTDKGDKGQQTGPSTPTPIESLTNEKVEELLKLANQLSGKGNPSSSKTTTSPKAATSTQKDTQPEKNTQKSETDDQKVVKTETKGSETKVTEGKKATKEQKEQKKTVALPATADASGLMSFVLGGLGLSLVSRKKS